MDLQKYCKFQEPTTAVKCGWKTKPCSKTQFLKYPLATYLGSSCLHSGSRSLSNWWFPSRPPSCPLAATSWIAAPPQGVCHRGSPGRIELRHPSPALPSLEPFRSWWRPGGRRRCHRPAIWPRSKTGERSQRPTWWSSAEKEERNTTQHNVFSKTSQGNKEGAEYIFFSPASPAKTWRICGKSAELSQASPATTPMMVGHAGDKFWSSFIGVVGGVAANSWLETNQILALAVREGGEYIGID